MVTIMSAEDLLGEAVVVGSAIGALTRLGRFFGTFRKAAED